MLHLKHTYLILFLIGIISIIGICDSFLNQKKIDVKVEYNGIYKSPNTLSQLFKKIILQKASSEHIALFENFNLESEIELETECDYTVFNSMCTAHLNPYFLSSTVSIYITEIVRSEYLDVFSPPPIS